MARVLCADDSAVARAAASRKLGELGLEVTSASSSREAVGLAASALEAALLDIDLGDGLGTDVAEALLRAHPGLPIAFLTAEGSKEALDRASKLGPVFSKSNEIEDAVRWIAAHALK